MMGNRKMSSSAGDELLEFLFERMRANEGFLRGGSEEVYAELVGLVNDVTQHLGAAFDTGVTAEDFVKCAVIYFLNHILGPVGMAIYLNALSGNLPGCYMELRLALESLMKCYLADLQHSDQHFFRDRLRLLEEQAREQRRSITRMMRDWDQDLGLEQEIGSAALWSTLSEEWVHAKGVMERIVDHVIEESSVPPWGLVLPSVFAEEDLVTLDELCRCLRQFRAIMKAAIDKYLGMHCWSRA
jgi:hypothetical protein